MPKSIPSPPEGTGPDGLAVWRDVLTRWDVDQHELAILSAVCRTVDVLAGLDAVVRADGIMDSDGRPHPAVIEARMQRQALCRLVASLRLPEDQGGTITRPARRGAARRPYSLPGSA